MPWRIYRPNTYHYNENSIKYLSAIALAAVSCGRKEAAQRPNVLLIVADDLGMGDLSIYGDGAI